MTLKRLLLLFSHHFRSFWIILAIGYFLIQQKTPFIFPILRGGYSPIPLREIVIYYFIYLGW